MIRKLTAANSKEIRLRNGIHFNTQQGIHWIKNAFQTKIEEMQAEVRTMVNPQARGSPAGRVRSHVPQPLADRLAAEAIVVEPIPSSDDRGRLGTNLRSPRSIVGEST